MQCGDISKGERKQIKEMPSQPVSQGATWCLFHPIGLSHQASIVPTQLHMREYVCECISVSVCMQEYVCVCDCVCVDYVSM